MLGAFIVAFAVDFEVEAALDEDEDLALPIAVQINACRLASVSSFTMQRLCKIGWWWWFVR